MPSLCSILLLISAVLAVSNGDCQFPERWGSGHWMKEKIFPVNNTRALVTYKGQYAVITSSSAPDSEISRFTCEDFDMTDNKEAYYVKRVINDPVSDRRYCVVDIQTANVILHKEMMYDTSSGDPTIDDCKTELDKLDEYFVFLPVAPLTTEPLSSSFDFPTHTTYPFDRMAYQVTYVPPGGEEQCMADLNSVLVITELTISILACQYQLYVLLPLTGVIRAIAGIDPRELGADDDANGNVLIVDWHSKSLPHNRTYCMRYKKFSNTTMFLSYDLTSGEPDTPLSCSATHKYNSQGEIGGRKYLLVTLHFDTNLVSRPAVPTTPRITTRPAPGASSTTVRAMFRPIQVQLTLVKAYDDVDDPSALVEAVIVGVSDAMEVDKSRTSEVSLSRGQDGSAIVNFDLSDGFPSLNAAVAKLLVLVDTGFYAILDSNEQAVGVKSGSVHTSTDPGQCDVTECRLEGNCGGNQEDICRCMDGACEVVTETRDGGDDGDSKQTIYIGVGVAVGVLLIICGIIIVVVIVKRNNRNRKNVPDDTDSETGYNNQMSLEQRDREIYSTINKQPKAFHEKSFSTLPKDDHYGEKTGIHL